MALTAYIGDFSYVSLFSLTKTSNIYRYFAASTRPGRVSEANDSELIPGV
jgi:hypothetical protein